MNTSSFAVRVRGLVVLFTLFTTSAHAVTLEVETNPPITELKLVPPGGVFHTTTATVTESALIEVPNSTTLLMHWKETVGTGSPVPYYAFSFDSGANVSRVRRTSYTFKLGGDEFDPLSAGQPEVPESICSDTDTHLYVVQFFTQPLEELRQGVAALGATVHAFLPPNSRIVEMDASTKAQVEALAHVRWVGPFHPAYRLESYLRDNLDDAEELFPLQRYNIRVLQPGLTQKNAVGDRIISIGGTVELITQNGSLMQATLTPTQLLQVIRYDEVRFVDRWTPAEPSMDKARKLQGATYVESVTAYGGDGVIGEVMDDNVLKTHKAFQSKPITEHGPRAGNKHHGTWVFGAVFGDGTGLPMDYEDAKGMVFQGQGIFADRCRLLESDCTADVIPDVDRSCHTCELVYSAEYCKCDPDPESGECRGRCPPGHMDEEAPYNAVFQTNSWGNYGSQDYDTESMDLDDILFKYDIIVCQSQGNEASPSSNSQAWSKNIVSVGGVGHDDQLDRLLHSWGAPGLIASHGPACDGRVKPDLTNFRDKVYTTDPTMLPLGNYTPDFPGTSAATPITCGHFGLFFQMWHEGLFPDCDDTGCTPSGGQSTVFDSKSHMTTAKAMVINTAEPYDFTKPSPEGNPDLTRDKQGWGLPSIGKMYLLRNRFPLIIDESKALTLEEAVQYPIEVDPGTFALKVTLVYADPPGAEEAGPDFVNDLDLKVTHTDEQQNETVFWGNCNLMDSNWMEVTNCDPVTKECCGPNQPHLTPTYTVIDTVENVFIKNPPAGSWTVEVHASEINQDGHTETPELDVDFALVVSVDFDCNVTGTIDSEDIIRGAAQDCNDNDVPDSCDIGTGTSEDCNANFVPDECDLFDCGPPIGSCPGIGDCCDANGNGSPGCDCAVCCNAVCAEDPYCCHTAWDYSCAEKAAETPACNCDATGYDCNGNASPDECDISAGTSMDCNTNDIPDECDIVSGTSEDCDANQVPDECDPAAPRTLPQAVEHQAAKTRYISIDPSVTCPETVAIEVELISMRRCSDDLAKACSGDADCAPGTCVEHPNVGSSWWLDAPEEYDGEFVSHVGADPIYRVWTEGLLHIGDCEIIPVATYEIRATKDGSVFSDPLVVPTIHKPDPGRYYGDVVGITTGEPPPFAWEPPNGFVNIVDIQAFVWTMQGSPTLSAPVTWVDLHGNCEGTPPNHNVNVSDLQRILFGFAGDTYTATPEQRDPADCPNPPECPDPGGTTTLFTLDVSDDIIDPGEPVEVEVYIDSVDDLGAIELALEVTGGTSGELVLTGITIDSQRQDYVFESQTAHNAKNLTKGSLSNALQSGSVQVTGGGYLATFTYQPSGGASGVFTISVKEDGASFLNAGDGVRVATSPDSAQVIGVGIDCFDDLDCDDSNVCTIDTCVSYACTYDGAAQGTACDDGMFCTLTDECDGNGTCTGSGSPCTMLQICDEINDRCYMMHEQ